MEIKLPEVYVMSSNEDQVELRAIVIKEWERSIGVSLQRKKVPDVFIELTKQDAINLRNALNVFIESEIFEEE